MLCDARLLFRWKKSVRLTVLLLFIRFMCVLRIFWKFARMALLPKWNIVYTPFSGVGVSCSRSTDVMIHYINCFVDKNPNTSQRCPVSYLLCTCVYHVDSLRVVNVEYFLHPVGVFWRVENRNNFTTLRRYGTLKRLESRFGLAVRRWAGKRKDSVRYRFGSPFSSKVVVCGHCLVTLSLTTNETLKWLSSLPILMQVNLVVTV